MTRAQSRGRIETVNGVQLYFEVSGTGEPLVLLHGFSGSSQDWMASTTEWGNQFQLIVPDLRGHGRAFCRNHSGMRRRPRICLRCSITWESAPARDSE